MRNYIKVTKRVKKQGIVFKAQIETSESRELYLGYNQEHLINKCKPIMLDDRLQALSLLCNSIGEFEFIIEVPSFA